MKRAFLFGSAAAAMLLAMPVLAQNVYDNGGMDPQSGGCSGVDYSLIEPPSTVYGNNTLVTSFHQADDFTVPNGQTWTPIDLTWYLYQSNSSPSEPITAVYVQIWSGNPMNSGTLLGGDMVTNRLIGSSTFANIYRVTAGDEFSCARAIKECKIDMSWVGNLTAGNYWIEIGSTGNPGFTGPWANHVVPRDGNENSISFTVASNTWTANTNTGVSWDYPFKLKYNGGGGGGYAASTSGSCPGQVTVAWSGAQPNKTHGLVFAGGTGNLTIPPGNPCAGTQLGLNGQGTRLVDPPGFIPTGNGSGSIHGNAAPGACGGYVQWVTGGTCATSTVAQLP